MLCGKLVQPRDVPPSARGVACRSVQVLVEAAHHLARGIHFFDHRLTTAIGMTGQGPDFTIEAHVQRRGLTDHIETSLATEFIEWAGPAFAVAHGAVAHGLLYSRMQSQCGCNGGLVIFSPSGVVNCWPTATVWPFMASHRGQFGGVVWLVVCQVLVIMSVPS